MNRHRSAFVVVLNLLFLGTLAVGRLQAQQRLIRLRNETITVPAPAKSARVQSTLTEPAVSGLFLLQCEGALPPTQRDRLKSLGVDLLRYVPDDAFVARFDRAQPGRIRAEPFVRWLGAYRPEHKLDARLQARSYPSVRVLLSPRASIRERANLRGSFQTSIHVVRSRFGAILEGKVTPSQLTRLAQSDAVLWIEPAPRMKLSDEISSKIVGGDDGAQSTWTLTQQLGFDGRGVTVAVADSGLNNGDAASMHPDLAGRVDAFFYYGSLTDAVDEHSHGTHVTGIIAGNAATSETDDNGYLYGLGVAPGAHIVAQRIFDGVGNYEPPPSFEALTHDAVRAGAEIGSNSWGDDTQGRYDLSAAEFDALVRDADAETPGDQPYLLEFSAGNAGPGTQTVGSPAVAKNVIASGASQNNRPDLFLYAEGQEAMADFSSRGPCEDGRIKPDVVAPGTWIASLKSASATDENAWAPISEYYLYQGGTSQAGPQVSGAAAAFVQYFRETQGGATPSPALVKAALINSAVDMDDGFGTGPAPNPDEGWGRVALTQLIGSPRRFEFVDQTILLTSGQTHERRVFVASSAKQLKITLAYTDVPGFPAAIPALVNDLDLEVVASDGRVYCGNQFERGESVPEVVVRDTVNNVEAVHLRDPLPGEYLIRVRARNVVVDARVDTPAVDQDFALVVSGDLPLPGVGALFFDRGAYRVPDQIRVKLVDLDLAGQPSVTVRLSSDTEANAEPIRLWASGPLGIFTNVVLTTTGAPAADGFLQVTHGDTLEVRYEDTSPPATRTASAVADLVPPVSSEVSVTNRFGRSVVSWTTDEPATGVIRYGTNAALSMAVTSTIRQTSHELALGGLPEGATCEFILISTDEAGNVATNDNGGNRFRFTVAPARTVLLVDAYLYLPEYLGQEIPVTGYTDALDQTGVGYEVWDVEADGSPTADDLRPFRVVMWRVNDDFSDDRGLTADEQRAVTNYLAGGGAFFLASMEVLTRLGDAPFRTNVLQVQELIPKPDTDPFSPCDTCDVDHGAPTILGVAGDPITSGVDFAPDFSAYPVFELEPLFPNIGPDLSDTFRPTTNATAILTEPVSGRALGTRFPRTGQDSAGRVVFLSFPLDAVPETGAAPNNRANLLRRILGFLAPGVNGVGTLALDSASYTIPARVTVEVADSDLAGLGQALVTCFSTTDPSGLAVNLPKTGRRGLFRGSVALVPATNAPAPGQLRAAHDDTIRVEYLDASAGGVIGAVAVVDTDAPTIAGVVALPDYESAEVQWSTSKPADALVQFGESPFLERTAYDAELFANHAVTIQGLRPDRLYYYRVVSRDAAGNTVSDDNQGQLYSFRTLKPLTPPWFDDLESGGTNWTVLDSEDTQVSWRLGAPNNGLETEAHSPVHTWGSNLDGFAGDSVETFLVSPALELTGGNVATLRFWHSYDFSERAEFEIYNHGQVLLVTNNAVTPITLVEFSEDTLSPVSLGWEEAELDLSPYLGRTVFLVWAYRVFAFDPNGPFVYPGWLVDDVSVTVSNAVRGAIVITNNLSQAQFILSGPISRTGEGLSLLLTNLLLGGYSVRWTTVPFYQTPLPQTNLVASEATVTFTGTYSFADANANGMSDAWETNYFVEVSPSRTPTTDTDGDGATDYAEFMAGTDPTSPIDCFRLSPPLVEPNGNLRFAWTSSRGRSYRLLSSPDLQTWTPFSDWMRATTTPASLLVRPPSARPHAFFRLEVLP